MNTYFFSKGKLQELSMKDLKALADYYSLDVPKNITKPTMVEFLYIKQKDFINNYGSFGISPVEETQMSVRVRRIKESQEGA